MEEGVVFLVISLHLNEVARIKKKINLEKYMFY
jgi:hypothetical protein